MSDTDNTPNATPDTTSGEDYMPPLVAEDDAELASVDTSGTTPPETDDGTVTARKTKTDDDDGTPETERPPELPVEKVPFINVTPDKLIDLYDKRVELLGDVEFTRRAYAAGTYENLLYNLISSRHADADTTQSYLTSLSEEDRNKLTARYTDPATGKVRIGAGNVISRGDDTGLVAGPGAISALLNLDAGGTIRIPLVNSGISLDLLIPDNREIETFLLGCFEQQSRFGSSAGANYFAFGDQLYKNQVIKFITPMIQNASVENWNKNNFLWSLIQLPDYPALLAWLAHGCYRDGFDNFIDYCTRPPSADYPKGCDYVDTRTIKISDGILHRWSLLSSKQVEHMIQTTDANTTHTEQQVRDYQKAFGFKSETITHGDAIFEMTIPSITDNLAKGASFLASIMNETEADNTAGAYARLGFRYMAIMSQWIATVERRVGEKSVKTAEPDAIIRYLEVLDDQDARDVASGKITPEQTLYRKLSDWTNKIQITWLGYPSAPCPKCGYVHTSSSGLKTVDPFQTFFSAAYARTMRS